MIRVDFSIQPKKLKFSRLSDSRLCRELSATFGISLLILCGLKCALLFGGGVAR